MIFAEGFFRLLIFGGADSNKVYNDYYILKIENLEDKWEWKKITPTTDIPPVKHGLSFDIVGSELMIFGGTSDGNKKFSNNIYSWSFSSESKINYYLLFYYFIKIFYYFIYYFYLF